MPILDDWIGDVVGRMRIHRISNAQLAQKCGYTPSYLSTVLNGKRGTEDTRERILAALAELEAERAESDSNASL